MSETVRVILPDGEPVNVVVDNGLSDAEITSQLQANPEFQGLSNLPSRINREQTPPSLGGFVKDTGQKLLQGAKDFPGQVAQLPTTLKNNPQLLDYLPDIAATGASIAFPPLAPARVTNMLSRTPAAVPVISDMLFPLGLDLAVRKTAKTLAANSIRFSPNIAASGAGGFVGSVGEDLIEGQVFDKIKDEELPSSEVFQQVFDDALQEGTRQMMFEIGGSAIYRGFEKVFLPNAELISQTGERVIKFAREHNLPMLPSKTTGTNGIVESIIEAFAPSGRIIRDRVEAMARLLEAPLNDSTAFVWKTLKLEGKDLTKEALNDPVVRELTGIIQNSMTKINGLQRLGNNLTPGLSGEVLDGAALLKNIEIAQEAGALKNVPDATIDALENLGLYAQSVHRDVNQFAMGSAGITKGFQPAQVAANVTMTGLVLAPLFVGDEGLAGTKATAVDLGLAAGTLPIAALMAHSVSNPKGGLFRWLSTGAVDSSLLREMVRADIGLTARIKGRQNQPITPPRSDVPNEVFQDTLLMEQLRSLPP